MQNKLVGWKAERAFLFGDECSIFMLESTGYFLWPLARLYKKEKTTTVKTGSLVKKRMIPGQDGIDCSSLLSTATNPVNDV
jgi:hypothetical protein